MKVKIIVTTYWIIGLMHIAAGYMQMPELQNMSKVLLMPLLIFLLFVIADGVVTLPRLLLGAGLVFSWGGDVLLINKDQEIFFLGGLGSFLIAQLLYTVVMWKSTYQPPKLKIAPIVPVIIFGLVLMGVVMPNVGNLALPIAIYSLCILMMVSSTILRKSLTAYESYQWAMFGAILFVLSDSLIAVNKFVLEITHADTLIMSTYIAAQYLIVRGILKHPGG